MDSTLCTKVGNVVVACISYGDFLNTMLGAGGAVLKLREKR